MPRQATESQTVIDGLASGLLWIRKHVEDTARVARQIEAMAAGFKSAFDRAVLHDRTRTYVLNIAEEVTAWAQRGQDEHMLISANLPKRGWYLSGEEPWLLSSQLAKFVREDEWDRIDQVMMEHLPDFKMDRLQTWLGQNRFPDHCIKRLCKFLKHHDDGNYEEATYLGVPLLDETAKHLYGKTFTTKRFNRRSNDQSKPELAFKSATGHHLSSYCESFVQTFGSLQEDPDHKALADENYWNRHAIVHGMMQRAMGVKDSSKCLMALKFLFLARREMVDARR